MENIDSPTVKLNTYIFDQGNISFYNFCSCSYKKAIIIINSLSIYENNLWYMFAKIESFDPQKEFPQFDYCGLEKLWNVLIKE